MKKTYYFPHSSFAHFCIHNDLLSHHELWWRRRGYGCISLTELNLGNGIEVIHDYMAYGCNKLERIEIPEGVTSIGNYAFYDCFSLVSVVIGDSVTSIGSDAFYECKSLVSVVIPNSVTSIGDYAFSFCSNLTEVYYNGTEAVWANIYIGYHSDDYLTNATRYYSETEPIEDGNFWHWGENGEVVVW